MKNHHIWGRFLFAFAGLKDSFKSERSFRTQVGAFACVVVFFIAVRPPAIWCALMLFVSGVLLALELVNTAVEKLADHLHPGQHEAIRMVKDALAGAVCVVCVAAAAVLAAFLWTEWGDKVASMLR